MIICVRSVEDSLVSQNLWNSETHQKVVHFMDIIESLRREVAALKEKLEMV
jgi:hypothetical protein